MNESFGSHGSLPGDGLAGSTEGPRLTASWCGNSEEELGVWRKGRNIYLDDHQH